MSSNANMAPWNGPQSNSATGQSWNPGTGQPMTANYANSAQVQSMQNPNSYHQSQMQSTPAGYHPNGVPSTASQMQSMPNGSSTGYHPHSHPQQQQQAHQLVPTAPGASMGPMSNGTNYGQSPMGSAGQAPQSMHPQLGPGTQPMYGNNGPAMMNKGSYQTINGMAPVNPMPSAVPGAANAGMPVQAPGPNPVNVAVPNSGNNVSTGPNAAPTSSKQ